MRKGPIVERRGGLNVRRGQRPKPMAEPVVAAPKVEVAPPAPEVRSALAPEAEVEAAPSPQVFRSAKPEAEIEAAAPSPQVFRSAKVEPRREPAPAPELPEPVETESFAELFARSEGSRRRLSPGQKVSGKIVQIGKDTAFLDLGGRVEALLEARELRPQDGALSHAVGETLQAYVRSLEDGVWLTLSIPKGARKEALLEARESGIPVEGTVTGSNKGGLEIDLGAGLRAFCPASQAGSRFVQDLSTLVGQRLQFLVSEVKDRDVVLSRRALLEREAAGRAEELRASLDVGAQLEGTVTSVREFGAFVDLGGLEGLIPIGELSHRHVGHPSEVVEVGQRVQVEVLRIEAGKDKKERIALSLKTLEGDPWEEKGNAIVLGQRLMGKVVRLQPFGAFVELFPGVDGLVHVSRLVTPTGHRAVHPKDALTLGQTLWVEVETIDRATRKLGLRPLSAEEAAEPAPVRSGVGPRVGDVVEVTVDKIESFGLFVRWPGGRGLLP
ncbi:MAG: 30S ribosomal protein S1, partial [Deltaproteobacteria bacterium]